MKCTCHQRKLPCAIHAPSHLEFLETVCVQTIVINVHEHWAKESLNPEDKRWSATVAIDAIRLFETSRLRSRASAVHIAANFLSAHYLQKVTAK